jgi:hypothetical protein
VANQQLMLHIHLEAAGDVHRLVVMVLVVERTVPHYMLVLLVQQIQVQVAVEETVVLLVVMVLVLEEHRADILKR